MLNTSVIGMLSREKYQESNTEYERKSILYFYLLASQAILRHCHERQIIAALNVYRRSHMLTVHSGIKLQANRASSFAADVRAPSESPHAQR